LGRLQWLDIPKGRFAVSVIRLDLRSYEALLRKLCTTKTTAVKSGVISLEFPGEARDSETTIATDIFLTGHSANPEVPIKKEIETVLLGYNFPHSTEVDIRK